MELFLAFTIPFFAYGVSVLLGTLAIKKFGGYPEYDLPLPTWNQAFRYSWVAETFAFLGLFLATYLLQYWGYALPSRPHIGGFWTVETFFIWFTATMFSNAIELFILRAWFGIYPRWGLVFTLGIVNALCSWPEIAHKLKLL
jgi:hypothetical protein